MARPTVPPIQFTKGELQMIDKGIDQFFAEWHNGYRSAGRVYVAGRIRDKVRAALHPASSEDSKNGWEIAGPEARADVR